MARMRLLAEKRDELTAALIPHVAKHNLVMTYNNTTVKPGAKPKLSDEQVQAMLAEKAQDAGPRRPGNDVHYTHIEAPAHRAAAEAVARLMEREPGTSVPTLFPQSAIQPGGGHHYHQDQARSRRRLAW